MLRSAEDLVVRLGLLVLLSGLSLGQPPQDNRIPKPEGQTRTFRITSEAVRLDVFVTDKKGNPVSGLTAGDFEVLQNGEPQEILTCSYVMRPGGSSPQAGPGNREARVSPAAVVDSNKRWITIVVNDLRMTFIDIARVRIQLEKFVERQLGPDDVLSIMQVSGGTGIYLPFSSDRRMLGHVIDQIRFQLRGACYG